MSVSGVRVKLDVAKPQGKRLVSLRFADGTQIKDKDFYSVTTNDYLLMGGNSSRSLRTASTSKTPAF